MAERDELLASLVARIEEGFEPLPLPVTLYCEGFVAYGEMITENKFFAISAEMFEDAAIRFLDDPERRRDIEERAVHAGHDNARHMTNKELANLGNMVGNGMQEAMAGYEAGSGHNYVHLKEAHVAAGGVEMDVPAWRVRLDAVKGFSYGARVG